MTHADPRPVLLAALAALAAAALGALVAMRVELGAGVAATVLLVLVAVRHPALAIALPGSYFDGLGLPRLHRGSHR